MKISFLFLLFSLQLAGCAQNNTKAGNEQKVGGRCEGCEAVYESPIPFEKLTSIDTLSDFNESGPRMEISGTIYRRDGKTPAAGVVMYFYHTDQKGVYPTTGNEKGWAKRHGYLRGWIKTDKNGHYKFYTLRPASYPNSRNPAHIHAIIKEPGKSEYWIDDFLFADDPFLPKEEQHRKQPKGGNGVLTLNEKNGLFTATRDIVLGLNIENY